MFTGKRSSEADTFLKYLADTYKSLSQVEWDYARGPTGTGMFIIDSCIDSERQLYAVALLIGKGLIEGNKNAEVACQLFEKLYKEGFKGGMYNKELREKFQNILPAKSIERLNEGASMAMADCMMEICKNELAITRKR